MAKIVVLGAGTGGMPAAYETKEMLGNSEPFYEKAMLKALGIERIKKD
jgi:hypothetical protein